MRQTISKPDLTQEELEWPAEVSPVVIEQCCCMAWPAGFAVRSVGPVGALGAAGSQPIHEIHALLSLAIPAVY